jgi:TolB-like protein
MAEGGEKQAGGGRPPVFISYASQDAAVADAVVGVLERAGLACWIAPRDVVPGALYADEIVRAINESSLVVLVLSARSVVSPHVGKELERASSKRRRIIALRTDGAALPRAFEYFLSESQWIEVGTGGIEPAAGKLAEAVRRHLEIRPDISADDSSTGAIAKSTTITTDSPTARVPSIAVLPFANMSGDPEQEYFSDGISEDIITDLSKVSALTVISRNSAFAFKGRHVDLPEVARQLHVTHVLEGSVRKAGGRVRITAQLIDGVSNAHLWAERYDRNLEDIFALQDEISQAIVKALKLKLLPDEKELIEERGTANVGAYDFFLRARALHFTISGPEVRRSLDLYRKAVVLDPGFARAWAGLGAAISVATIFYSDLRATALAELEPAITRATELAPDLPDVRAGQIALCTMRRDWARAEHHLAALNQRAGAMVGIGGTPGMLQCILGRANEAVNHTLVGRQADPLSLGLSFNLQLFLGCAGRFGEAEAEYERSKELPGARGAIEWRAVTRSMALKDDALVRQRFAAAFGEDVDFMPFAPELLKVIDEPDAALAIVRAAFENPACQDGGRMGAIAHWAVYYGDEDFALKALRRGYVELYGPTVVEIWSPVFAGPRRDPRFKGILRDIGLYDHWRRTGKWGDFARSVGDDDFEVFA